MRKKGREVKEIFSGGLERNIEKRKRVEEVEGISEI